ncbi:helix-turn-helix transcriptional regulator [Clostridium botulinum]|nr:DNA-binding protein [Clostridium botulinum CFSAN002369]MCS4456007.1 helix-turn-helix transcriptional regulator [Clostridium botulinum]MCS4466068.1 helix-turn-helix transcriptional regulator [Clostridium botulinum]MCS4521406.1 helix-turn-helix transcriptional regulator [Clostridium botulinum]MCS4524761.1 helix-turn-helix transcriptional regulator [Clostridium botulinum]
MRPNKEYILELVNKNNWSQNKFAKKAGVSNATISRWTNGKRGAGSELIAGIIRAFPNESINKLFFYRYCCCEVTKANRLMLRRIVIR